MSKINNRPINSNVHIYKAPFFRMIRFGAPEAMKRVNITTHIYDKVLRVTNSDMRFFRQFEDCTLP